MQSTTSIDDLGSAVQDDCFPEVDLALRRGRHIDRDDNAWYAFLIEAQAVLEPFYRRFGCELVHKSDGYFYLLPTTDQMGKRQLSVPEMIVGQALALLYLDPKTLASGGVVTRDDVLSHMAAVMTADGLVATFNPGKRRVDERLAQENVRARVAEGLRKLGQGGFIELLEGDALRLRAALMRFAEPVRGSESPAEALAKLVARGEVVLDAIAPERAEAESPETSPDAAPPDQAPDPDGPAPEQVADPDGAALEQVADPDGAALEEFDFDDYDPAEDASADRDFGPSSDPGASDENDE